MFQSARITLTLWYLLIIMTISISFSAVIFEVTSHEIDRAVSAQRFRIERRMKNGEVFMMPNQDIAPVPLSQFGLDDELVHEIKRRFMIFLGTINFAIFVLSGGLAYFLAGKTLRPIKIMVDDQNRFIADASHELKTPLTALKSAMEVHLRDPKLTIKEARTLIQENIEEVNKLQSLSESLLQLTQYQNLGAKSYPLKSLAIHDVLHAVIKKTKPMADQKKVTLELEKIPDLRIMGNMFGLQDLFTILIDNAIKYSKSNGVVRVSARKKEKSVVVTVSDDGVGIQEKDIPFIFDRFYRADQARTTSQSSGYGLGLSIAQKIARAHDGSIKVQSIFSKGTVFSIQFPLK